MFVFSPSDSLERKVESTTDKTSKMITQLLQQNVSSLLKMVYVHVLNFIGDIQNIHMYSVCFFYQYLINLYLTTIVVT